MRKLFVILGLIFTREMHAAAFLENCAQLSTGNYRFGVAVFAEMIIFLAFLTNQCLGLRLATTAKVWGPS